MPGKGTILVFVDLPDGALDETGRGLLSYGARLSGTLGLPWAAVVPAAPEAEPLSDFTAFGTPEIVVLKEGERLKDTPARLGSALSLLARERGAVVLLPHNDLGGTLAPVVAGQWDAALLTEVVSVRRAESQVELTRLALGLRIAETKHWDGAHRLVLTVPVRVLSQVLLPYVRPNQPSLSIFDAGECEVASGRVTGRIPPDPQTVDLTEAEVIFSVGKGCDPASFEKLKELCRLLNVSCGVTRPVYDLGWTGFERMVGQTGRTVTPRLYLALGISGSMHHVGGIKDSRRIVSVNIDPKAPIFPNSNEGFVADLKEILPQLVERAKSALGGAA